MAASGSIREVIEREAAPLLAERGLKLLLVDIGGGAGGPRVQVVLDRPRGAVTSDDCEWFSERLSLALDAADPIAGRYYLEVSSPGVERPLLEADDFARFAGRTAEIATATPLAGRRRFTGVLRGVEGGRVELEAADGERLGIPLEVIAHARLKVGTDELFGRTGAPPRRRAKRAAGGRRAR